MVHAVVKKWGNSFGVVIPAELAREHGLSEGDVVDIGLRRKARGVGGLFGSLRTRKSGQRVKDEMRAGWDD